ncbi:MAG TPA: molybdopterin cofactor-binding domain-containing protein [Steroidobacteraceae bacterium]|nr:molybdopterin cofactor-binding domain-containing protein [Steroidobacteraceae bacterium]
MQQPGSGLGQTSLTRRQFIVSASRAAGGLVLGIGCADLDAAASPSGASRPGPARPGAAPGSELSAWIEIDRDGTVIVRGPTPEIGNGSMTQVAMNVTEELACDWSRVKAECGSVQRDYLENGVYSIGFQPFFGGHSTEKARMQHALQLGASARERLKAAAAARWNVPVSEIEANSSILTHTPSARRLRYGEVAAEAAQVTLAAEPALKPRSEWTFLGKASPAKLSIPQVVTGKATYGIDVKVPGMVHAALKQSPVQGGTLKSHRPEAVLDMPGVRAVVVIDPAKTKGSPVPNKATWGLIDSRAQSAVAVIADHYWQAKRALDALPVEWDGGPGGRWESDEQIYAAARALLEESGAAVLRKSGEVAGVTAGKVVEGVYSTPYSENAMMEPLNGTALVTAQSVEVWCPTQDAVQAWWVAIDETGMPPEKVRLHQTFVGGAFGRRTQADDVRMAVAVAKEYPGVAVKTIWSREECFQQGRYRTPIVTRFKAVLGDDGYPLAVTSKASFVGSRPLFQLTFGYDDMPYFASGIIPNVHFSSAKLPVHVLNGAYRGPCFNSHAFLVETFIDECAVAAGIDPLDYRLKLVSRWDKSWADCLRIAAQKAGWGQALPRGEGRGIAITCWPQAAMHDTGTVVCAVARVKVSRRGELSVEQIDIAFDCGGVVNRDAVRAQIEGGAIFGVNMTLNEKMTLEQGAMVERNFDRYPMLRIADRMRINVHFEALSGQERFAIIGEAPVGPVGPAVGNAIFQATGKRLRSTPFRDHGLSWT